MREGSRHGRQRRRRRKRQRGRKKKGRETECLSRREAAGSRSQTEASPSRRPEITRARARGKFARQLFILKYARAGMHPGKCARRGLRASHGNERGEGMRGHGMRSARYSRKQPRAYPSRTGASAASFSARPRVIRANESERGSYFGTDFSRENFFETSAASRSKRMGETHSLHFTAKYGIK